MKLVNRKEFLKLPEGVFYVKAAKEWTFEDICVKERSLENNWWYYSFSNIASDDCGDWINKLDDMKNGASYPVNDSITKDGMYEEDALFLIFEKEDLIYMRGFINRALEL